MTAGHGAKMNRKQEEALAALLVEPTVTGAAKRIGINEKTLRRWLKDTEFQEEYRQARQECFERAQQALLLATVAAVDALNSALRDQSSSVRVRAGIAILELASKAYDDANLEARIERLENTRG